MISRRRLLQFLLASAATAFAGAAYAVGYGPMQAPRVTRYRFNPRGWSPFQPLTIVALSDIHAIEPWMSAARLSGIVDQANALAPDIVLLLGDFVTGMHRYQLDDVPADAWAKALGRLKAPLGVHAILGNHDWWEDAAVQASGQGMPFAKAALESVGIRVYHNDAVHFSHQGTGFWLAGLADQIALPTENPHRWRNLADLPGTLAKCTGKDPILLMAHEPDIFPSVPDRVSLTLCGHTHGGQVSLFGWRPVVPSRFGRRYAYGHIVEEGRDLIVSGGLGCSIAPIRVGVPPEIVMIELGAG